MRALCDELDRPQDSYRTLHVVGTNGKSSVTRMTAALLAETGLKTGACVSPHVRRWSERTLIDGAEIDRRPFAAAVDRVAAAVAAVESGFEPDDEGRPQRITQFEAAIATSFVAFADAAVDVAAVEAGLGGRLDATNVIASGATALTSVGLDHTEWLGETEAEIAAEKLDVLQPGTALVVGELEPEIMDLARRTATDRDCVLIEAAPLDDEALPGVLAPFLRRDAAVAVALAGTVAGPISGEAVGAALAPLELHGRAELIASDPPAIADAAHNEAGARALAEALPALAGGRPVVGCLSVLADKDARAIAAALAPSLTLAIATAADPGPAMGRPGARAHEPGDLAALLEAAGVDAESVADPVEAIARTHELARGRGGVALFAGSHYLLRYLWKGRNAQSCSR